MHQDLQEGHLMYQVAAWRDARSSTKQAMPDDASRTFYSCAGVDPFMGQSSDASSDSVWECQV